MTTGRVLYDDSEPVAEAVRQVAGVQHYGDLLFRRQRQAGRLRTVATDAGWEDWVRLRDRAGFVDELNRLQRLEGAGHYLLLPSRAGWDVAAPELRHFLRALRLAEENVIARKDDLIIVSCTHAELPLVASLQARGRLGDLAGSAYPQFADIAIPLTAVDLARPDEFMQYFSNAFETRHFNLIDQGETAIEKWSADKEKIRREYTFLTLVPEQLKLYFANVFGFREDERGASYRVERFYVPDAAVQWVHESMDERACAILLARLSAYFTERPTAEIGDQAARAMADQLYRHKVTERIHTLEKHQGFGEIERAISLATRGQSLAGLAERYFALYEADAQRRTFGRAAFTHGDLCLSNILFSRDSRIVKFIDVRGAADGSELFSDEYYDLAKLSHSFLGRYDWVNNDLVDLVADGNLALQLVFPGGSQKAQRAMFTEMLSQLGYSLRRVRLYEASLFLSMAPLHVDHPKKIVQFAAIAARLLDALEGGDDRELQDC